MGASGNVCNASVAGGSDGDSATAHAVIELYTLPLPAAHLHLGPMSLRDALLTLAGPAWELHADDRTRQVCFEQIGEPTGGAPILEPPATAAAAQPFPLAGGRP